MTKRFLGILVLGLLWCNISFAGEGASCGLEVDKSVRSQEHGWIRFEVYNPTNKAIIVTGVKYFKDGTFWREYSDIYETVGYKRNAEIVHSVNTTGPVSFILQCHAREPYKLPTSKSKSSIGTWIMWIAIAAVVIVVLLTLKGYSIDKKEKQEKNKNVTKTSKDPPIISEAALFNLIKKIWDGDEDLVKAFWIYFIVISNIVWFIGGFLSGALNALWILIFPLAVMIITAGGAWNSSTKYKNKKLIQKQGYGWATAAKVVIVLGFLSLAGPLAELIK